jgi:hypothetical protein
MGIEPRSKTRRLSPEPRKDSMAPVFVRSKNRNEVRPKTFVAGPIARSPSPATGAGKGKDPARQQPGAQQAHLSGYATYRELAALPIPLAHLDILLEAL